MTSTARTTARNFITGLAVVAAAATFSVAGAGAASAQQYGGAQLVPGAGSCSNTQYASYQVRGDGTATAQGAKFKLLRNGVVVANTANRANYWSIELRSSQGTFPGPGYYSICAQNTGTSNTNVTLQLKTDAEV